MALRLIIKPNSSAPYDRTRRQRRSSPSLIIIIKQTKYKIKCIQFQLHRPGLGDHGNFSPRPTRPSWRRTSLVDARVPRGTSGSPFPDHNISNCMITKTMIIARAKLCHHHCSTQQKWFEQPEFHSESKPENFASSVFKFQSCDTKCEIKFDTRMCIGFDTRMCNGFDTHQRTGFNTHK